MDQINVAVSEPDRNFLQAMLEGARARRMGDRAEVPHRPTFAEFVATLYAEGAADSPPTADVTAAPAPRPTRFTDDQAVARLRAELPGRAAEGGKRPFVERALADEAIQNRDPWLGITTLAAAVDPDTDPAVLAEAFRGSMRAWADANGAREEDEMRWVTDLIASAQPKARIEREAREREITETRAAFPTWVRNAELQLEMDEAPILVRYRNMLWVRRVDGGYELPLDCRSDAKSGVDDLLAPWIDAGRAALFDVNDKGAERRLPLDEIVRRFGRTAGTVLYGAWPESHFDIETRTFRLAAAPLANIEPKFEPQADRYLEILVGAANKSKLEDWLAGVTRLDRQCAALYLYGPRGTGKNLLASACARQWESGVATPMHLAVGRFNDALLRCPFVHADERVDADASRLRQLFEPVQTIEVKNQPTFALHSSLRILITANSGSLIKAEIEDSAESLAATSIRVIRLEVDAAAGAYLSALPMGRNEIVNMLARHVAWLRQRGVQQPGRRYLVEPTVAQAAAVQRDLEAAGDEATARTLEALVEILTSCPSVARIGGGEYLVTGQRVWEQVEIRASGKFTRRLIGNKIGRFAKLTSKPERRDHQNRHFYKVRLESVLSAAEALGHDIIELRERINDPASTSAAQKRDSKGLFSVGATAPAAEEVAS
jgi:hypothetical protein